MKSKKILCITMAILTLAAASAVTAQAQDTNYPIGYYNIAHANRYLTFATDGGSFIKALEKPIGTVVDVTEYVPTKEGYIFDGWYLSPRNKVDRVYAVTLTENIVLYAKWLDDGTPKSAPEMPDIATDEEIMQYGNYVDEITGVPVTAIWVQQNARLEALMKLCNEKFN